MQSCVNRQIMDLIHQARQPILIADRRIDGDCLGSALAMADYLASRGAFVPVFVAKPVPEQYHTLPLLEHCTTDRSIFNDPKIDLVVVFDCSERAFVEELVALIPNSVRIINIDHHATNDRYGHVNQVLPDAPATCSVVHGLLRDNGLPIRPAAATWLLTGLASDTSLFMNSATTSEAFAAASDLLLCGAQGQKVVSALFRNSSVHALRLWGLGLERLHERPGTGFVWTCLTAQDMADNGVTEEEATGLSNFLSLVTEADTVIVFRDASDGGVKASLRTRSGDVAKIAQAFGGGGHIKAAGFTIQNARLRSVNGLWGVQRGDEYATIEQVFTEKIPDIFNR